MGASDFDKILTDGVKMWKPNDGDNRIRILPPTWDNADHYGIDIYVHYGVGADRGSYLDLHKMKNEDDPIHEAMEAARQDGDEDLAKELSAKRRVLVYLIDRDHPKDGVQAWAMPWGLDRDITNISKDKSSGEVYKVDHPRDGFDVEFVKKGAKMRTEYVSVAIARRSSDLGKDEWLEYAQDNPLPKMLNYYSYDHIKKAMGGGSYGREASRDRERGRDDDRGRSRDDDRGRDDRGGRDRDDREERRPSRERERDDDRGRGRSTDADKPTWKSVHQMTKTELQDLVEDEKLKIDPREAKDLDDLANWICDEMGLKKEEERRRVRDDDPPAGDRLRDMRERRERD